MKSTLTFLLSALLLTGCAAPKAEKLKSSKAENSSVSILPPSPFSFSAFKNVSVSESTAQGADTASIVVPPKPLTIAVSWPKEITASLLQSSDLVDWSPVSVTNAVPFAVTDGWKFYKASGSQQLTWDASPSEDVLGYKVHYGTNSGIYPNIVTFLNTGLTNTVTGLVVGQTNYFVATAFNSFLIESKPSNEFATVVAVPDFTLSIAIK